MKTMKALSTVFALVTTGVLAVNAQKVGDPAPDFMYKDTQGADVILSSFKGKVVFLYLFGNACPYCEASGNTTETMVQQVYGGRTDFQALGLDLWDGSLTLVNAFQSKTKLTYPLLLNASSMTTKYSTTYDRVLVIDQEGKLRHKGIKAVSNGLSEAITVIEGLLTVAGLDDPENHPVEGLEIVYPNPVTDLARIRFSVKRKTPVNIRLLNTLGQEAGNIKRKVYAAGTYSEQVRTADLPAGLYFVRMDLPGSSFTRKLLVTK